MPLGPWRHIFRSLGLAIFPSFLSNRSSRADCLITSQGFLIRVGDVIVGAGIGAVISGRAIVPFSLRGAEALSLFVWPLDSLSSSEKPMNNLSPCLSPTCLSSTPGKSARRRSRSRSGFELTGRLLNTIESASVFGGRLSRIYCRVSMRSQQNTRVLYLRGQGREVFIRLDIKAKLPKLGFESQKHDGGSFTVRAMRQRVSGLGRKRGEERPQSDIGSAGGQEQATKR